MSVWSSVGVQAPDEGRRDVRGDWTGWRGADWGMA